MCSFYMNRTGNGHDMVFEKGPDTALVKLDEEKGGGKWDERTLMAIYIKMYKCSFPYWWQFS